MSIKIKQKEYPLGYSDLIPEGICGLISDSKLDELDYALVKRYLAKTRPAKPKSFKKVKKPNSNPLNDIPKFVPKAASKEQISTSKPEKTKVPRGMVPELNINYKNLELPDFVDNLDISNIVQVSESTLQQISKRTEKRTKALGNLLLRNTVPSILANAAALNYVGAVMQDSFDIEFEEDPSITEALKDITKFEVLEFFVDRLKIPFHRKEMILAQFIDKLTTKTVDRMESSLKAKSNEHRIKTLEAVLLQRSKGKDGMSVHRQNNGPVSGEHMVERPMITVPERNSRHI
jgi:hypothetical protein